MAKYYFRSYTPSGAFEKIISAPNPYTGIEKALANSHPQDFTYLGPVIGWNEVGFDTRCNHFLDTIEVLIELGYLT